MRSQKGKPFNAKILACPQCMKRHASFKALNQHLLKRHDARYIVRPPKTLTGSCRPIPRPKRRAYAPVDPLS